MGVIRSYHWNRKFLGKLSQALKRGLFIINAVPHDLNIEIFAEEWNKFFCNVFLRKINSVIYNKLGKTTAEASGKHDKALMMFLKVLKSYSGLAVKMPSLLITLIRERGQERQILITLKILCENGHVKIIGFAYSVILWVQIEFRADDRLDTFGSHLIVKGQYAVHISMIGYGAGIEIVFLQILR